MKKRLLLASCLLLLHGCAAIKLASLAGKTASTGGKVAAVGGKAAKVAVVAEGAHLARGGSAAAEAASHSDDLARAGQLAGESKLGGKVADAADLGLDLLSLELPASEEEVPTASDTWEWPMKGSRSLVALRDSGGLHFRWVGFTAQSIPQLEVSGGKKVHLVIAGVPAIDIAGAEFQSVQQIQVVLRSGSKTVQLRPWILPAR